MGYMCTPGNGDHKLIVNLEKRSPRFHLRAWDDIPLLKNFFVLNTNLTPIAALALVPWEKGPVEFWKLAPNSLKEKNYPTVVIGGNEPCIKGDPQAFGIGACMRQGVRESQTLGLRH